MARGHLRGQVSTSGERNGEQGQNRHGHEQMTLFDKERAKEAGKHSGEARRRKERERLTADRVPEELPPLDSAENAQRRRRPWEHVTRCHDGLGHRGTP